MPADDNAITTPNRSVEAGNGVTCAYRRFGDAAAGQPPLVLLKGNQHDDGARLPDPPSRRLNGPGEERCPGRNHEAW